MSKSANQSRAQRLTGIVASITQAEGSTGYPITWIKAACDRGGARTQGGRVDLALVAQYVESHRPELEAMVEQLPLKEQKLAEQVRQLRIRNDREYGKLVEKAWVMERHSRMAGEMNGVRAKSESEDAMLFAATNGDIALCRSILRGIWDRIFGSMQDCAKHFEQ